ncbi:MAG TPA: choice-of-anchor L domain-containing protein, partial [Catalimonadaceae bacterium]|nr:choice-of-anchor L domain-containing protein [Catalimonadaceae bacterium]
MIKKLLSVLLFAFCINSTFAQNNLVVKRVDPVTNPLVDSLVGSLVGSGVIVENIRTNLVETSRAIGTFRAPQNLFGIKEGLVMVTGFADTVAGANTAPTMSNQIPYEDTTDQCSIGRQMLNSVLDYNNTGTATRSATDCATIQFDIIPATDSIKFNYVFASEEYNTFVCSNFNDIFGFFIKGPGIPGDVSLSPTFDNTKNIALIPGTDLPVAINTVNNGTGTPAENCTFTPEGIAAYIDNTVAANHPQIYNRLKFNGLTQVLTAGVKVIPCQTYTLTLTISDVTDRSWDSGVFIEKGSLRSSGVTAVQSSVFDVRFPYAIVDCNPGKFIFERCAANTIDPLTARYKLSGTAVNGFDYLQQLPGGGTQLLADSFTLNSGTALDSLILIGVDNPTWATQPTKTVVIKFLSSVKPYINGVPNYRGDSTTLTIKRRYTYNANPGFSICQGTDSTMKPLTPFDTRDRFHWVELTENQDTAATTSLSCTDCPNPRTSADTNTTYVLFVNDSLSGCQTSDTVKIKVFNVPTLSLSNNRISNAVCKGDDIRLFANATDINPAWKYVWTKPLTANNTGVDPDSLKERQLLIISHNLNQFYKVTATNELGCKMLDSIEVRIITRPIFKLPEVDTVCYRAPYRIIPAQLTDTLSTLYSWTSSDNSVNLSDSLTPFLTIYPKISARYILAGRNNCVTGGVAKDTFNIHVIDSISAGHTYTYLNDSLTAAPVK